MYGCHGKMKRIVINWSGEERQGSLLARSA